MCQAHGNPLPLRKTGWADFPSCDAVREKAEVSLLWTTSWLWSPGQEGQLLLALGDP